MPSILPGDIVKLYASGSGNMGTVGSDSTPGTFRHPDGVPWVLAYIRLHFEDLSGSATGTADCSVYKDRRSDQTQWNALLWKMKAVGLDTDAGLQVTPDELYLWSFDADEAITLTWTNPDSADMGWGVEVGLVAQSAVRP